MHAPYDKQKTGDRTQPKSSVGFLVLMTAIPFVLVAVAILHPRAPAWISQAVEAEFIGDSGVVDAPTQLAKPDRTAPVQTVRVD